MFPDSPAISCAMRCRWKLSTPPKRQSTWKRGLWLFILLLPITPTFSSCLECGFDAWKQRSRLETMRIKARCSEGGRGKKEDARALQQLCHHWVTQLCTSCHVCPSCHLLNFPFLQLMYYAYTNIYIYLYPFFPTKMVAYMTPILQDITSSFNDVSWRLL